MKNHPLSLAQTLAYGKRGQATRDAAFGRTALITPAPTAGSPTIASNLRYPGQYEDEETGLYYNWNRSAEQLRSCVKTANMFHFFWGISTEGFNCIRRCLIREDEKYRREKPKDQCDDCLSSQETDEYHDICFKECNISTTRYPGVPNLLNPKKE